MNKWPTGRWDLVWLASPSTHRRRIWLHSSEACDKMSKGTLFCVSVCVCTISCNHTWSLLHSLQVFALSPDHPAWKRERQPHHGGAHRTHTDMQVLVKHSNASSQICDKCEASGLAERTSQWCTSSGVCPRLLSNLLPYQPRHHRLSISAPLNKKRKMKIGYE